MGLFGRVRSWFGRASTPGPSTFGIGGHGLLLSPLCPCRATHLPDGSLQIGFVRGFAGPTLLLRPGAEPAEAGPPAVLTIDGRRAFRFGAAGPTLQPSDERSALEHFVARVDAGVGASPWTLLGPGFWMDLPAGFAALGAAPGDADPLFELHRVGPAGDLVPNTFVSLEVRDREPDSIAFLAAPGMQHRDEGRVTTAGGLSVRWVEVAYEVVGERWVRRYYVAPFGPGRSLVASPGAREADAAPIFAGADAMLQSFALIEE